MQLLIRNTLGVSLDSGKGRDRRPESLLGAHLAEWHGLAVGIAQQMALVTESQNAATASLQRALEPMMSQARMAQAEIAASVPRVQASVFAGVVAPIAAWQREFQASIAPALEPIRRSFLDLPPRIRCALLTLASQGWYLDIDMPLPDIWGFERSILDGDAQKAEEALCAYFEARLDEVESTVAAVFPHRAHIVRPAFEAHRRSEYALSIPVLLAQTDGMCKEVTDHYLFRKSGGRPETAQYVEQLEVDSFTAIWLAPLSQTTPINASRGERPDDFDALNRHQVLHGDSLDYDTKANSLKAVSLISYVADAMGPKLNRNP